MGESWMISAGNVLRGVLHALKQAKVTQCTASTQCLAMHRSKPIKVNMTSYMVQGQGASLEQPAVYRLTILSNGQCRSFAVQSPDPG
jgi:hypothetical protein